MINITEKKNCCGCNACYDACTKHAITLQTDIEGFSYPYVDKDKCVDCGLCERVCPQINITELKKNEFAEPVCFAARHKDMEVVFGSTTGGMFSALAQQMYSEGGYVGGAIYREDWSVAHFISNNPDDLKRLRQSKYSQSDTRGFYKEVKRLLIAGEKVLVCGTPCQMAALRSFLRKDYENLIIVDFICKSITSPKFFHKYLESWERKANSKLVAFKFKDKELGWRNLTKRFDFKNGKSMYSCNEDDDYYHTAYHGNLVSRPSCYLCQFKGFPRLADITIADFWGCERYPKYKSLDENTGTSAVIVNNFKGLDYFKRIKNIDVMESDINEMIPGNPALVHPQSAPLANREEFFKDLDEHAIEEVVPKYATLIGQPWNAAPTSKQKIKGFIKAIVKAIRINVNWYQFMRYNFFCSNVNCNWAKGGFLYPLKYSVIELQKGSILSLNGPLILGIKKVKNSHLETRLLLERSAKLEVNKLARFFYGNDIEVFSGAELLIDRIGTNANCCIICGKRIRIEGHVSLGRDVSIRDTNAHTIVLDGYKVFRPVTIENHVWLCSGSTICPGVRIKSGAVVGANSYVIQNVPAHSLVSGAPAKVVYENIAWKL